MTPLKYSDETVCALLDCLIPGEASSGWPAAGQMGLGNRFIELMRLLHRDGDQLLQSLFNVLPDDFADATAETQVACLAAIEKTCPTIFDATLKACYSAYYTNPEVREIIEAKTGYEARPPQPQGYPLEPFDESLLDPVRARGPIWRPVP
ncbi:MAG: hypothetical protein ACO2ZD_10910 [Pseudomonadales bacterium]|nr:hypothetical protein [Alphaproteobacteria bacterium]